MYIRSIKLWNFRGFASRDPNSEWLEGPLPVEVALDPQSTVVIGRNGTGKSAFLQALLRLFGETRDERSIQAADFFVSPGERLDSQPKRELFIEALIAFPELESNDPAVKKTVPSAFKHMIVEAAGETPFARLRLEASWEQGNTLDGVIEEKLYWLLTTDYIKLGDHDPLIKRRVTAGERHQIIVRYLPASRDVTALTRLTVRSLGRDLMGAVVWENKQKITDLIAEAAAKLDSEAALSRVNDAINKCWKELNTAETGTNAKLAVLPPDLQEIIRSAAIQLDPSTLGRNMTLEDLSDGQRSLFHFALVKALLDLKFALEAEIADGKQLPFNPTFARAPALTIFAFEEPENHLAPYFLSRLLTELEALTTTARVQGVLTSHAPAIVGRIEPTAIRHTRRSAVSGASTISSLALPENGTEAAKFVREAVRAHPEIYFARHAIFGEGASEEIVLPWLADKLGVPMDRSFVAIVPIGGRHIQHFWRLVDQLGIPHSTLLDLDLGRSSGDLSTLKTIAEALLERCVTKDPADLHWLQTAAGLARTGAWGEGGIDDAFVEKWTGWFQQFGVFFSGPLDLDMLMLEAFPEAYQTLPDGAHGPQGLDNEETKKMAARDVVGVNGYGTAPYDGKPIFDLFIWYKYLFLGNRGKPATHLFALSVLEADDGLDFLLEMPTVLWKLITSVENALNAPPP